MRLSILAAVSENGVIGRKGELPWHLPAELRHVKRLTTGHTLIMGRKTYESIGRPLPERTSIVITHAPDYAAAAGVIVVPDFEAALAAAQKRGESEAFVFGGEAVYALALPRADRLYLTRVHTHVAGDAFFPALEKAHWKLVDEERHAADERHAHAFTFQTFDRA
ncbi:MAG: dihydrofolate reductase [Deltaproteobacteria bacterium]|nr:dihydrofolate reductase [Deltaproteobacteria bacterium]MBW2418444.1 dihydrofolate reductase [Deltaproteobacteria bacterium]